MQKNGLRESFEGDQAQRGRVSTRTLRRVGAQIRHARELSTNDLSLLRSVGARGLGHDRVLVDRVGHGRELAVDVEQDHKTDEHDGHHQNLRVRCVDVHAIDATVNELL